MVKGLPLSYDRDMQEDKAPLFEALDTVEANLKVFTAMISSAKWNVENLEKSVEGGFANATDLAEYLVQKGMSFRTAHGVAAKTVRAALDAGLTKIEDLSIEEFQKFSPLIEEDIFERISPRRCMENRTTTGGPSPKCTEVQIKDFKKFCSKNRKKV